MSSIKEWVRGSGVRDSLLPAPVNQYVQEKRVEAPKVVEKKVYNRPPYGQRANYIPRRREDYGDGGAFPEIHIAQYPLDMGRSEGTGDTKVVAVATDENGIPDYQKNLLAQGRSKSLVLHSRISELTGYQAKGAARQGT